MKATFKSMARPRKPTREVVVVALILCSIVLAPVAYLSSQAQRDISEQFINHATSFAVSEFRGLAVSMSATLRLVRDWGESGLFTLGDSENINRLLLPVFDREPMLYGISVADIDGSSYYIRKFGAAWRSIQINADHTPRQSVVTVWGDHKNQQRVETQPSDYDPRNRPWFAPALGQKDIFWTEPYKFYDSKEVGMTASISYKREKDQKQVVVAFDILLDDLFTKIQNLAPSAHSRVFIIRHDSQLYVPKTAEHPPDFRSITSVKDSLIRQAYANWIGVKEHDAEVITLKNEGTTWWAGFLPLDPLHRTTWICVMVPEEDIVSRVGKRRIILWLFGLGTVLVVTGLVLWLSRRSRHPAGDWGEGSFDRNNPEAGIQKLIMEGEGPGVEFKSTLRMNLHAKRPGKEIELAWLKAVAAFLNTDGGILLLGVTDQGKVTGLEQDVFENEDKCKLHFKNLIAEHVGAEFSKYIDFQIYPVGTHTVGVVVCKRSNAPVYLKHNKIEAFYIRNGPSSDELPGSKVLNYLSSRR